MALPSFGSEPGGPFDRAAELGDGTQGSAIRSCKPSRSVVHSAFSVITSVSPARVTTRRSRPSSGWRLPISAIYSGRTNMPLTLVVWSARPIQPLMRMLVRPHALAPGNAAVRSPSARRIQGWCGSSEVTTISPTSPGATGSPVPGRTISRIRSSLTTMPSCAGVSNATMPRSAVPNA